MDSTVRGHGHPGLPLEYLPRCPDLHASVFLSRSIQRLWGASAIRYGSGIALLSHPPAGPHNSSFFPALSSILVRLR
ncbi:hypothetical protein SL003B_0588 [Polymorphum gilvum SL003B-26A1]|uniref:Uncharacterized protein n=1 Tax=Polymorphum gilvum (strain LMG 25793 / CGMCC 1.9160 / SL003B-26A1) TaxID=991905 RepID=F2J4S8_POLGS|nr:hypothetical protein SL003B_0588 [Polymorphum gilvum SL003B-26A1]